MSFDINQLSHESICTLKPYQPGKPIDELKREFGFDRVIKLASNENPLGASPRAIQAAKDAVDSCHLYPDGYAYDLRMALIKKLGITPEQLILGAGSDNIIGLLTQAFCREGSEVIMSEYAFAAYYIAARSNLATPVIAPSQDWGHDLAQMASKITDKTTLIFIANPNNPTATWLTHDEISAFLEQVPDHVLVVIDEAYFEYMQAPQYPDTLSLQATYPNLMVIRTFSKVYALAGLRVGYGIAHPDITSLLNRIRLPFNVTAPSQAAATAALSDDAHLNESIKINEQGRQRLRTACEKLQLPSLCTAGNFASIQFGPKTKAIYQGLLQHGIITRPLAAYKMPEFLRITIGLPEELDSLLDVLPSILASVN